MIMRIFALAYSAIAAAQNNEIVLFPDGAPNETAGFPTGPERREGNDGQGCGPNRSIACDHIYNVAVPTMTAYLVSNGTGGAVIIAPGGGYTDLAWTKEGEDVAFMYNEMGVSAFVLKYRVPARPNLPFGFAPLQDAQRAIGIVRANASQWGLDPRKIGFTGFSAGGHLTAHISTTWQQREYPRIDDADDVSCRPDFSLFMYPWKLLKNNDKSSTELAPELVVAKDHPPSFFCQNADDTAAWVQGTLQYNVKMMAAGAPHPTTHIFPKGGHGFGVCAMNHFEEVCDWPQAAKRFIQDLGNAPGFPTSRNALPCEDGEASLFL